MHRIEVLTQASTDEFEFWSNKDGSVYLCKEAGQTEWKAIVDGDVVANPMEQNVNSEFTFAGSALVAVTVQELVLSLAMDHNIHAILDTETIEVAQ